MKEIIFYGTVFYDKKLSNCEIIFYSLKKTRLYC